MPCAFDVTTMDPPYMCALAKLLCEILLFDKVIHISLTSDKIPLHKSDGFTINAYSLLLVLIFRFLSDLVVLGVVPVCSVVQIYVTF